jgi:hypothetical protein
MDGPGEIIAVELAQERSHLPALARSSCGFSLGVSRCRRVLRLVYVHLRSREMA